MDSCNGKRVSDGLEALGVIVSVGRGSEVNCLSRLMPFWAFSSLEAWA